MAVDITYEESAESTVGNELPGGFLAFREAAAGAGRFFLRLGALVLGRYRR